MTDNATYGVRLTGDDRGALRALRETRGELTRTDRALRETARHANTLGARFATMARDTLNLKSAFAGLAAAFSADALLRGAGEAVSRLEDIERTATGLGTTTDAVQEFGYAFRQVGLEAEDVSDALTTVSQAAHEIETGTAKASEAAAKFGVSIERLRGRAPDELFELMAKRIAAINAPVERTASRRGPDGQQIIDVMVRDAMERVIGSGQMDSTFAANFAARRPGRY